MTQRKIHTEEQALSPFQAGTKVNCLARVTAQNPFKVNLIALFHSNEQEHQTTFEIRTDDDTSCPGVTV